MRLVSIETTPNPNSMKLNVDGVVEKSVTYTAAQRDQAPEQVAKLLDISGVTSVFACHDFMTLIKDPRADWKHILEAMARIFEGEEPEDDNLTAQRQAGEKLGQVHITVQTFRGVSIQVKAVGADGEKRVALPARFNEAAQHIQTQTGADYLKERYWADWGVRYGSLDEVAAEVAEEINGTVDDRELKRIVAKALGTSEDAAPKSQSELTSELNNPDWHRRLIAVQELGTGEGAIDLLIEALKDPNQQVRRLVAAALGASGSVQAIKPLTDALLNDSSIGVRRTAGDALSDLADVSAQPAMCRALSDANKLVRWRAARFLADVGTDEALPFLTEASNDPEFEVKLEIEAALERIGSGKQGTLPMWKKILKNSGVQL